MKTCVILAVFAYVVASGAAAAACFADYKAKQDQPLRLHYGIMELPDVACGSRDNAAREIARRIQRDGWTLLNVVSIFDEAGLNERRGSAGDFFLRY